MADQQKNVPINQLHPQQILMVRKQLEEEIQILGQSYNQFKLAANKYEDSKVVMKNLKCQKGSSADIMVPVTGSLYLPGKQSPEDKVMIDYGTGFFVERTCDQASQYCDRKVQMIKANVDKIGQAITAKKKLLENVNLELQKKYQQQQQAAQGTTIQKK